METNTALAQALEPHVANLVDWLEGVVAKLAAEAAEKGLTEDQAVKAIKATIIEGLAR